MEVSVYDGKDESKQAVFSTFRLYCVFQDDNPQRWAKTKVPRIHGSAHVTGRLLGLIDIDGRRMPCLRLMNITYLHSPDIPGPSASAGTTSTSAPPSTPGKRMYRYAGGSTSPLALTKRPRLSSPESPSPAAADTVTAPMSEPTPSSLPDLIEIPDLIEGKTPMKHTCLSQKPVNVLNLESSYIRIESSYYASANTPRLQDYCICRTTRA